MRRDENLNDIDGLDVVDFGLGSVLYDVNTHQYYTPNTGDIKGGDVTVSEDGDENISYSEHIPLNTNERGSET